MSEPADDSAEVTHPDPDSVAAKLRRIRSVVAQSGAAYGEEFTEDEHAQDFLGATASDLEDALAEDDATELQPDAADVEDISDIEHEQAQTTDDEPQDDLSSIIEQVASADEPAPAAEALVEEPAESDSAIEDTLAQLMADATPEEEVSEVDDAPEAAAAARDMNVCVVKMKRSDLDDAIASGQLEEDHDEAAALAENLFSEEDTINPADDGLDDTLSPEEEAELQRELAEVEAEFGTPEVEDATFEQADIEDAELDATDPVEDAPVAEQETAEDHDDMSEPLELSEESAILPSTADDLSEEEIQARLDENLLPDDDSVTEKGVDKLQRMERDSDVSRIFDEADTQRDEPEQAKRRNAIQHLRAAVAATRAEKSAGSEMRPDVDETPYRTDLADVVRPRRPRAEGGGRSERPTGERPAPLKLVAEQRIDTDRAPVRPRRITTTELEAVEGDTAPDGSNFTEFAAEMGANNLAELLEAAAAYMADVEGRPQFSRPMLMGKLKEVEGDSFSREDGLRSFGQLLRQGKLQKLKGGRFAVTDETEFRAPTRNAG